MSIYDSLANCIFFSSRTKEDAIANAHQKHDLKTAAERGDIAAVKEQVKQLNKPHKDLEEELVSWGSIKFSTIQNKD